MEKVLKSSADFEALVKSIKVTDDIMVKAVSKNFELSIDELLEKYCYYWIFAKPVLILLKILTPPKVDKIIDEFILISDKLCGGASGDERSKLLDKFANLWPFVRLVLEGIKAFTGVKADKIIYNIIKIGDLLTS